MKLGLAFANTGPFAEADGVVQMAVAAEQAGVESVWTVEHVIWPSNYDSEYPYSPTGKMPGDKTSSIPDPLGVARVRGRAHRPRCASEPAS